MDLRVHWLLLVLYLMVLVVNGQKMAIDPLKSYGDATDC